MTYVSRPTLYANRPTMYATREDIQEHLVGIGRHPSVVQVAQYFAYEHLSSNLRDISKACNELAFEMIENLSDGPELAFGLRQLLLAKDAFVRAGLD